MAVIPGLEGLDVTIRVNSTPVTEHSTEASRNAVTTYISAAVPNTEFEVFLSITSEYKFDCPTLGFDIFVDGVKLAAKCCLQSKRGWVKEWVRLVQGAEMGELDAGRGEVRPFMFSKMGEGEIKVEVHRRDHGQRVDMDYVPEPEASAGFKLGLPRPMAEPVSFWYAPLLDPEPLGVFRFIYGSEEGKQKDKLRHSLKAQLTPIPEVEFSSSNTIPSASMEPKDDPDTEKKDGILGLAEQSTNQSNIAHSRRIKREHSDDEDFIHPKKAKTSAPDERTKAVFHWNGREVLWNSVPWFDSDDEGAPVPVIKREREISSEGGDENHPSKKRAKKSKDWDAYLYNDEDAMDYLMDY